MCRSMWTSTTKICYQVICPKLGSHLAPVKIKFEAKACCNEPSKDRIKVRLQMLQNWLSQGKTSDSVTQKMFERDLELEMLRRKKTYQF